MKVQFDFLSGDLDWQENGGTFISQEFKMDDGTPYYFIFEVEAHYNSEYDYEGYLHAISPAMFEGDVNKLATDQGIDEPNEYRYIELINEVGGSYLLSEFNARSPEKLTRLAVAKATLISKRVDAYLSKYANQLGSTGYDFLRGDVMAGLKRRTIVPL